MGRPYRGPEALVAWPHEDGYAWRARAACASHGGSVSFYGTTAADDQRAKAICRTCPVIAECRAYALANRESWGVWGGMTTRSGARSCSGKTRGAAS